MSMHIVAEKKSNVLLKGTSNGLIENEDVADDWRNGKKNLLMVAQDVQSDKEAISLADNQSINLAIDIYCS